MKLLTLLILAPMVAGAQVTDTSKINLFYYSGGGGVVSFDTSVVEISDTAVVHMLVADTCDGSIVRYVKGYQVTVRKYVGGWLSYGGIRRYFLNAYKKKFEECYLVWDAVAKE